MGVNNGQAKCASTYLALRIANGGENIEKLSQMDQQAIN